jgi:hypothetical protein
MRALAKTAVALGFIGATAIGTIPTVQAQGYYGHGYHPHRFASAAAISPLSS